MTVRKPLYALGLLSLTLLLAIGIATPAGAAQVCDVPPGPAVPTCFSTSTDTVTIEQPVPGTTTNRETFSTRVVVHGPDGPAFDQTVDAAADSTTVADLQVEATASVGASGWRVAGTDASIPERALVNSSQAGVSNNDHDDVSVSTELTNGPATVQVGPDRSETLSVPSGVSLFNTNTRTTRYVNVATNTTNTYLTTATITITAVAPASATTAPDTTTTPTAAPRTAVSPAATGTSTGSPPKVSTGQLARTGSSNGPSIALGITLVIAGAGCLHLSRRTARHQRATHS